MTMSPPAGLLATIELSSSAEPALHRPPPVAAELPETVLSIICSEALLQMAPPLVPARLAPKVELVIVAGPLLSMAPPTEPDWFR